MSVEIKVPVLPESVADATVATWHKKVGDAVSIDENLVDIETEKVVLEVPSTVNGVIKEIRHEEGATVGEQEVLAIVEEGAAATAAPAAEAPASEAPSAAPASADDSEHLSPAVRKLVSENNLDASAITGTGKNGRILKEDVLKHIEAKPAAAPAAPAPNMQVVTAAASTGERTERREPMSRIRATIARRLKESQNTQAMLTTFNDVNLQKVMDLRKEYKDAFIAKHDTKLGFMSFFVKASVEALKRFPEVNASIDGDDIVYHNYYDVGIAASSPRGLVVPVLRDVDKLSFADVEKNIGAYGAKAKSGKLSMEELTGGTFTISNGGTFGSMLSTPIVNPPQSAILGMHRIEQRPIAENGEVVIRPMMYLALTYDHRIIDGAQSVLFLRTIKECLEDPARLLLEV